MSRKEFHLLLRRYLNNESSKEEAELIEQWYKLLDDDSLAPITEVEMNNIAERIWSKLQVQQQTKVMSLPFYKKAFFKWSVAAAIILIAAISLWQFSDGENTEKILCLAK